MLSQTNGLSVILVSRRMYVNLYAGRKWTRLMWLTFSFEARSFLSFAMAKEEEKVSGAPLSWGW